MAQVTILGSASAVPDLRHENTHLLVAGDQSVLLIDCPGSPHVRLEQAGINPHDLTGLVLTHFHPDHVSGFAPLLMGMWLTGRRAPLRIFGLEETLNRARQMLDLFDWHTWPNFYPVEFHPVPGTEQAEVFSAPDLQVHASPGQHLIPSLSLRFTFLPGGQVVAYSCDTQPNDAMVRLAAGCDVLIHEATGPSKGHSTPQAAGEIATRAGAGALVLIHYPPQLVQPDALVEQARTTFAGDVRAAEDFMVIPVGGSAPAYQPSK